MENPGYNAADFPRLSNQKAPLPKRYQKVSTALLPMLAV